MTILIYYPKTQQTQRIDCELIEVGPGGIHWTNRGKSGFVGYDTANYTVTIVR